MSGTLGEGSGALLCHCCYIILGARKGSVRSVVKRRLRDIYTVVKVRGHACGTHSATHFVPHDEQSTDGGSVWSRTHPLAAGSYYKQYVAVGYVTIHRVKWDGISNMSNSDSKKTESRFPGCHVLPHRSLGMRLEAGLLTIKYLPSLANDIAWRDILDTLLELPPE